MNWRNNREAQQIAILAFLVVAASMVFYFFLFRTSSIGVGIGKVLSVLNPVIYGGVIAYILNPQQTVIENTIYKLLYKYDKKPGVKGKNAVRVASVFLSLLILILIIYGLGSIVVPEMVRSIRNIIYNFQRYVNNINTFINTFFKGNEQLDEQTTALINDYAGRLQEWLSSDLSPKIDFVADNLTTGVLSFVAFVKNFFLGMIISVYILAAKENLIARFRRVVYSVFSIKTGNRILFNLRFMDEKFGGFIIGKLIDSAIIGVICYFCCVILRMPYAILVAVVIGVTNVIPFFGPFIGAIPSTVLIFVVSPFKALIFIIFILILQQFDGNVLGPRILGSSVGISSFMVVLAILIGGGFLGVTGMVIGVPFAAVFSALFQGWMLRRMRDKNLPGDLESYHYLKEINPINHELIDEDNEKNDMSLYDRIRFRDEIVRSFDEPLKERSWERKMEDIEREDSEIDGTYYKNNPSARRRRTRIFGDGEQDPAADLPEDQPDDTSAGDQPDDASAGDQPDDTHTGDQPDGNQKGETAGAE
ncbi:MAG: AI-2E family transporter [Lachnospiraceae bacterium]|nr:AI-2E family transporter [Lachnospiraceae bacterium]